MEGTGAEKAGCLPKSRPANLKSKGAGGYTQAFLTLESIKHTIPCLQPLSLKSHSLPFLAPFRALLSERSEEKYMHSVIDTSTSRDIFKLPIASKGIWRKIKPSRRKTYSSWNIWYKHKVWLFLLHTPCHPEISFPTRSLWHLEPTGPW